jgi:hypothetical protein
VNDLTTGAGHTWARCCDDRRALTVNHRAPDARDQFIRTCTSGRVQQYLTRHSTEVQQRPRTAASSDDRQHTKLAGTTSKRPAAPLVRDEEAAVPAACPIGRSTPGTHGHSRTARYTGSPAYRQADPLRKPTSSAAGRVAERSLRNPTTNLAEDSAAPIGGMVRTEHWPRA